MVDVFQVNFRVFPVLVAVFHQAKRLVKGLSILLVDGSTGRIGQRSGFYQILIAVVQTVILRPLADNEVHADGIAGHLVLRDDERTAPVVVEWRLLPLGERFAVDVASRKYRQ